MELFEILKTCKENEEYYMDTSYNHLKSNDLINIIKFEEFDSCDNELSANPQASLRVKQGKLTKNTFFKRTSLEYLRKKKYF